MSKHQPSFVIRLASLLAVASFLPEAALAAPEPVAVPIRTASLAAWIALAMGGALVLALPLFVRVREWVAERRTLLDLRRLACHDPRFDWQELQFRLVECFHHIHVAWNRGTMADAAPFTTNWFWQHQQLTRLDRVKASGLRSVCRVGRLGPVRPLHVCCRSLDEDLHGSRIALAVTARIEDYVVWRESGAIAHGTRGLETVRSVWTLVHEDGCWRVAGIEESLAALCYARLGNEIPDPVPIRKDAVIPS